MIYICRKCGKELEKSNKITIRFNNFGSNFDKIYKNELNASYYPLFLCEKCTKKFIKKFKKEYDFE